MARCRFALLMLLFAWLVPAAKAQQRPPNIVFLYADDLGWGDVGFNGRKDWKTPNLDRLARQGTKFNRWYTAGVVCAPSRAALLTGRYGIHNGVSGNNDDLPERETTLAQALKARGYATMLSGKWHRGALRPGQKTFRHPMDLGFDEFFGFTSATEAHRKWPKKLWHGRVEKESSGYADTLFADHALEFMERQRDRPFFLYLAFTNPHFDIDAPEEDVRELTGRFPEEDPTQPHRTRYAAMLQRLDKEIGRILKALDQLRLSKNTLVVFTSDHGATFETGTKGATAFLDSNRPFRGQKRTLWEGGIRVPAVVRWPGHIPAGRVSEQVVHMIDVMPTLLAAAGASPDPSWKVDGWNVLSAWMGKSSIPDRTLFWEWRVEGYDQTAAMRGDWKLVVTEGSPPELFNLKQDPAERRNRFAEMSEMGRGMLRELKAWLATETEESRFGKPRRRELEPQP